MDNLGWPGSSRILATRPLSTRLCRDRVVAVAPAPVYPQQQVDYAAADGYWPMLIIDRES